MAPDRIKAALDATPLTGPTGGIRRYTAELSLALAREFPGDEYWLLSDQQLPPWPGRPANLLAGRPPSSPLARRWWSAGLPRRISRLGADVFHGTDFAVPYLPLRPSVMTLHDLSPWISASWNNAAHRVRRRAPYLIRLGLATLVITPSQAIRREAISAFNLHPSRVVAIPLAASEHFQPIPGPHGPPFFLYVGALEPRKNLAVVIDAWRALRHSAAVDLILVGPRRPNFPEPPPEPGLRYLGEVPDTELPRLYSAAVAVLYPSLYEGFGLPALEAMRCGAAVFLSRIPALAELAGDAALLLEPSDAIAWRAAMSKALDDADWLAGLRAAATRRSAEFSWARTARLTREAYLEAVSRFGR